MSPFYLLGSLCDFLFSFSCFVELILFTDHIFEKVNPALEALGMECKCLGGGKIEHNSNEKKIRVFGESTVSLPGLEKKCDMAISTVN